jgi:transcriptional regulator with XRE-family HTH domain
MRHRTVDGPAVWRLREQLGLTRPAFAVRAGISLSHLKNIEFGPPPGARWPSDRIAHRIATALGCTVEDFSHADDEAEAA